MDEQVHPTKPTGAGALRGLNIRKLENGFIGSASYEPAKTKKNDPCCSWVPEKEYVLANEAAVFGFISDVLGFKKKKSGNDSEDLAEAVEGARSRRAKD